MNIPHISKQIETDLLIVGSGIAGLSACVQAHKQGIESVLISKVRLGSGASFFPLKATLGIQVTGDKEDHELFRKDIERVAGGMNNPKIVSAYIEDSAQAIELLEQIGFSPWCRNDNRPACFARYARPVYLINQWKQAAVRVREIIEQQNTSVFEHSTLLYIVVQDNQVQGALFSHQAEGETEYIFCKTEHIILAGGGIAGLYRDNLYPADIIGSMHFIALQAGVKLTNLEFIQFIPSFVEPKYKVLFGEHTLKYCTQVTDEKGNNLFPTLGQQQFAEMVRERSDYAPFSVDFPCVAFDLTMMKYLLQNPQQRGVYLQYSEALYRDNSEFYQVYLHWLEKEAGINLLRDKIAIAPFAHSCNGGIEIDEYGQSAVTGLFAIGEISSCIEGANRLGGNSVGGGLVFAKRAVRKIKERLSHISRQPQSEISISPARQAQNYLESFAQFNSEGSEPSEIMTQIRELMAQFANVYRTEQNLIHLLQSLKQLERQLSFKNISPAIETYQALQTAKAVVESMLTRRESRGAHYRADYPNTEQKPYRLVVSLVQQDIVIEKR